MHEKDSKTHLNSGKARVSRSGTIGTQPFACAQGKKSRRSPKWSKKVTAGRLRARVRLRRNKDARSSGGCRAALVRQAEKGEAAGTTERDEEEVPESVDAFEVLRHGAETKTKSPTLTRRG